MKSPLGELKHGTPCTHQQGKLLQKSLGWGFGRLGRASNSEATFFSFGLGSPKGNPKALVVPCPLPVFCASPKQTTTTILGSGSRIPSVRQTQKKSNWVSYSSLVWVSFPFRQTHISRRWQRAKAWRLIWAARLSWSWCPCFGWIFKGNPEGTPRSVFFFFWAGVQPRQRRTHHVPPGFWNLPLICQIRRVNNNSQYGLTVIFFFFGYQNQTTRIWISMYQASFWASRPEPKALLVESVAFRFVDAASASAPSHRCSFFVFFSGRRLCFFVFSWVLYGYRYNFPVVSYGFPMVSRRQATLNWWFGLAIWGFEPQFFLLNPNGEGTPWLWSWHCWICVKANPTEPRLDPQTTNKTRDTIHQLGPGAISFCWVVCGSRHPSQQTSLPMFPFKPPPFGP